MHRLQLVAALAVLSSSMASVAEAPTSHSAQDSSPAFVAAKELFRVQITRERWDQIVTVMLDQQAKAIRAQHKDAPPDLEATLRRLFDEVLPFEEMNTIGARLISERLEAKEIEQITAFYRTPVGQKATSVMPQVMADAMTQITALVQRRLPAAAERLKKQDAAGRPAQAGSVKSGSDTRPRAP